MKALLSLASCGLLISLGLGFSQSQSAQAASFVNFGETAEYIACGTNHYNSFNLHPGLWSEQGEAQAPEQADAVLASIEDCKAKMIGFAEEKADAELRCKECPPGQLGCILYVTNSAGSKFTTDAQKINGVWVAVTQFDGNFKVACTKCVN